MTAKEYLSQLKRLDTMIDQKVKELSDLQEKALAIGGIDYAKDRVQISPGTDARYAGIVQKIADLEREINHDIDEFADLKLAIIARIHKIEDQRFFVLLYKRYVEYKSFQTLEDEMHYSRSHIMRLHAKALREFEKMIQNET